jgi:phosphopantetheinyl transferase
MVHWIETLSGWDGGLPATLVATGPAAEQRDALPRALVARALGCPPETIELRQPEGGGPVVARPSGSGLHVSKASRGVVTVVSVAASPVGVDVERLDVKGEIPWNVLHPAEAAMLRELPGLARARAFTRLWSLKEAYAKALGVGLLREPSSYEVRFADASQAAVYDPLNPDSVAEATTIWRGADESFAISTVILSRRKSSGRAP